MNTPRFGIPEYHRFLSESFARELLLRGRPVEGIPGVVQIGEGGEPSDALRFAVDLYRELKPRLGEVLRRRVADRAFIDERTRALYRVNQELGLQISDPEYRTVIGLEDSDGRIVVGPHDDHYCLPGGAPVAPIPSHLQGSHVTLFGPPDNAKLAVNAMNAYNRKLPGEPAIVAELLSKLPAESASPKWGADDEDSKTPMRASLIDAAENLAGCFNGTLRIDETASGGRKYELAAENRSLPIKRFPGLALPCAFLFVDGSPIPLHLYDFALHLYEHRRRPEALVFYVPKLENEEEAAYIHAMIAAAERRIQAITPEYKLGTVRLMIVLENPRAILRAHEIMDALHPYFAGASLGWHDYLGSMARLFKEDGNYRIPVKADPDIVIKHIQASHRLLADVVGSRGGIKVGGMYGILPVTTDLRSPSFQVTLLGYFKDVITQLKRDLTGFWVAHPDFVRLGLALVQAWKLRVAGDPAPLRTLCREILSEPYSTEIEKFIEGSDIAGLTPGQPGYVRKLLVADLRESDTIPNNHPDEVRYNVFQSLQYLVDWLSGNGCVALPAIVRGTPVRVMDDLATAERSRWEVWHEVRHGRVSREELVRIAFEELQFIRKDLSDSKKIVQVKWDERTAKWYPVAFHLMLQLMTDPEPVEFATELLLPFTMDLVRNAPDPLSAVKKIDPSKYALDPWVARFCHFFEALGSVRFAREMADATVYDAERARAIVLGFSKAEVIEGASFHGNIGESRKGLDAQAAAEQAGVSEQERETIAELRRLGAEYLAHFGFKFLISARGKTGAEMLEALRARLKRSEAEELASAREALWQITETRLGLNPPDLLRERMEAARARHGVDAAGVAVLRRGRLQSLGFGCTNHSRFQIASLSKTVATAYAFELFASRGIALETPVDSLLEKLGSEFRLGSDAVTIAHLVSHQALGQHYVQGFAKTEKMPPLLDLITGRSAEARENGYLGVGVVNPPGTKFQYSGGGFLVLEYLIEQLTGMRAADAIAPFLGEMGIAGDLTFDHAQMTSVRDIDGIFDTGEKVPGGSLQFPGFAAGAAGTAEATAKVLDHLARAYVRLEGSSGISHDTAVRMLQGKDLGCREFMGCEIGLGVFVIEAGDNRLMLHQGSNEGFRALFLHCFAGPDAGTGFVILCNADNRGVPFVAEVAQELLRAVDLQGVDFSKFGAQFYGADVPQEQKVNRGYRDLLFNAFLPQLPESIEALGARGPLDPLASRNLVVGASIVRVSNQRFARAENLISAHLPDFDPKLYGRQGKVMDSWESARHNPIGMDVCELRLKAPGEVRLVSLSTQFHDGNHPEFVRLCVRSKTDGEWTELLPKTRLQGHSLLRIALGHAANDVGEVRVEMFPDGGLSRLGLYSDLPESARRDFVPLGQAKSVRFNAPIPKPSKPLTLPIEGAMRAQPGEWASLAAGGRVAGVTNEHYGPASQVISPYPALHMFDGFESARSREPGHLETLELELGAAIRIERIVLDFEYFVNNNPRAVRVLVDRDGRWDELVPWTNVKAFAANRKEFHVPAETAGGPVRKLRFEIEPDGGINRVRVYGKLLH